MDKLIGLDFHDNEMLQNHVKALQVSEQIDKLIEVAKSPEILSGCYFGWCAFW
jgi:phosphatidylinositol kinase/protein kinase (PI-3  family)